MSPLLQISLAIVFCLWVIPLTWAIVSTIRALPGIVAVSIEWLRNAPAYLFAYLKSAPARYLNYVERRHQVREAIALEGDYQIIASELTDQRSRVEKAIAAKERLESKILKESEECQELQAKIVSSIATQREIDLAETKHELLLALKTELGMLESNLDALRIDLEEKELAVQTAYTNKQVLIAMHKAEAAKRTARELLGNANGITAVVIDRMEAKVERREAQAYGRFFLEDRYVSFPGVAKAIDRLSIEKLELDELEALLEAVDNAASELHTIVHAAVSYERILRMQAETSAKESRSWARRAEIAKADGKARVANDSKQFQSECEKSAEEFRIMLESSRICSVEFTEMHASFAQKEREIFKRIDELQQLRANVAAETERNSES